MEESTKQKMERLKEYLASLGSVAVAFSGGVDSTFLLKTAHETPGVRVIAVTAVTEVNPERETREAEEFCRNGGIRQLRLKMELLSLEGFAKNPPNRCYLCKKALFKKIGELAAAQGIRYVAEGSNVDDMGDYRPGMRAIAELGVKSPLREAGLTKAEIRELSRSLGLPTWDKPSFACLASRFVYGETITQERLSMAERAERLLQDRGFRQMRVRMHGTMARIEVPEAEIGRFLDPDLRREVTEKFREYGFSYVALDLCGYRTGSMNEGLGRSLPRSS